MANETALVPQPEGGRLPLKPTTARSLQPVLMAVVAILGGILGSWLVPGSRDGIPPIVGGDFTAILEKHQARCIVLGETWCSHCKDASEYLRQQRVDCPVIEISKDNDAGALYERLNRPGFPILLTSDSATIGFAPARWGPVLRQARPQ